MLLLSVFELMNLHSFADLLRNSEAVAINRGMEVSKKKPTQSVGLLRENAKRIKIRLMTLRFCQKHFELLLLNEDRAKVLF